MRLSVHASPPSRAPPPLPHSAQIYNDITETIGDTPIVKLQGLAPEGVDLYAKCEFFNPLSSVKDRLAISVISDAEAKGLLKPGDTVVEATSGNTGIAVAMVCAQRGYNCVICMAEPFSVERRKIMRMLGAKVIVTPKAGKGTGMVRKAEELCEKHGWFLCHQFENAANPAYHASTTGPEILKDFAGKRLDYWVTGYGTGGTFQGVGRVLKAARPDIKVCAAADAAGRLQRAAPTHRGHRRPEGSRQSPYTHTHAHARAHAIFALVAPTDAAAPLCCLLHHRRSLWPSPRRRA